MTLISCTEIRGKNALDVEEIATFYLETYLLFIFILYLSIYGYEERDDRKSPLSYFLCKSIYYFQSNSLLKYFYFS